MQTSPPLGKPFDSYTPVIAVPKCLGCAEPSFVRHRVLSVCIAGSCHSGPCRAQPVTTARYVL